MKLNLALTLCFVLGLALAGCGVDVATTAATTAAAKAEEAKQAQKTKEHLQNQINAAMAAGQQRLRDAEQANQ